MQATNASLGSLLATSSQSKVLMVRVVSRGRVEHAAYLEATALHASSPFGFTRVIGHRSHTEQGCDLTAVEPADFGQLGDQGDAGHRANATGRAQQPVQLCEVGLIKCSEHLFRPSITFVSVSRKARIGGSCEIRLQLY